MIRTMDGTRGLQFSEILERPDADANPISWDFDGSTCRLSDFRSRVARVAAHLVVHKAERWALSIVNSTSMSVALFACVYAGKQIILPGNTREAALREQQSDFDAILTDTEIDVGRPHIDIQSWETGSDSPALDTWKPETTITFFTSGSTGKPKAIVKSFEQLERENHAHCEHWGKRVAGTTVIGTTAHQHLYGLQFRLLLPMTLRCPFNATVLEYHEQLAGISFDRKTLVTSPAFLKRLDPGLGTIPCAFILSAGGMLTDTVAHKAIALLECAPFEIYGSTETGAIAWRDLANAGSLWTPFAGVNVSFEESGRISVQSGFLPDDNLVVMDDQAEAIGDQFLLKGRMDRVLKLEEKRISLAEIEARLLALEFIEETAVLPLKTETRTILGAALAINSDGHSLIERLGWGGFVLHVRRQLSPFLEPIAIPRRFRIVDSIPLTAQGKLDHEELHRLFL